MIGQFRRIVAPTPAVRGSRTVEALALARWLHDRAREDARRGLKAELQHATPNVHELWRASGCRQFVGFRTSPFRAFWSPASGIPFEVSSAQAVEPPGQARWRGDYVRLAGFNESLSIGPAMRRVSRREEPGG